MMSAKKLRMIFILSVAGTVFATTVSLRQFVAPTTEPGILSCVGLSIFGLSPCPYGLALFLLLAILSGLMLFRQSQLLIWLKITSLVGVAFSAWVVWRELCLPALQLGPVFWETFSIARVPACAWGFLVFVAVLIMVFQLKYPASPEAPTDTV